MRGYTADWDNITMTRGKNGFMYNRSTDRRWMFLQWDSDGAFQQNHIDDVVVGTLTNVGTFYSSPYVRRQLAYYLTQMIGPLASNRARIGAWIAAEEAASTSYSMPSTYASWPTLVDSDAATQNLTRHQQIQNYIGSASLNAVFLLTSPPASTAANTVDINGRAPTTAFRVDCVGHPEAVLTWTGGSSADVAPWRLAGIMLTTGNNLLTFRMYDNNGAQVGADITHTINKTTDAPPVIVVTSNPSSQNVALGELLNVDAIASYDPDGTALTSSFAVSPASGFTMTSPSTASRNLIFNVPGTYNVTIQATDGASQSSTATRSYTGYNTSDFDSFGGSILAGYTITNSELRDKYSPTSWYSLDATDGSLVVQLTGTTTIPLRQTAPAFPLITRLLPTSADFVLQTNFSFETRNSAAFSLGSMRRWWRVVSQRATHSVWKAGQT